jgi:hypothetical protein
MSQKIIQDPVGNDPWLNSRKASRYIGTCANTMAQWRERDIGPPYVKLPSGTVSYRLSDLNAFMLKRLHQTTRLPALSSGQIPVLRHGSQAGRREAS